MKRSNLNPLMEIGVGQQIVQNAFNNSVKRAVASGLRPQSFGAKQMNAGIQKVGPMTLKPKNSWQKAIKGALIKQDPVASVAQQNRNNLASEIMRQRADEARRVAFHKQIGMNPIRKSNATVAQRAADNMNYVHTLRTQKQPITSSVNRNGYDTHEYARGY